MSAKSIGYTAIALQNGTYTSASIGVNSKGQITQLISNTISPEAEGLTEDYDALVAIVDNSFFIEEEIQGVLRKLIEEDIPDLTSVQAELITATNDLQAQYDALEAEYLNLNTRFTPTLAAGFTAQDLNIPVLTITGSIAPILVNTFTLPAGKYTWFINLYGTFQYIPFVISGVYQSLSAPPNPLDASQLTGQIGPQPSYQYNSVFRSATLFVGGVAISCITGNDYTDVNTPSSGTGLNSQIDHTNVWTGSNTFVLATESTIEFKYWYGNNNILGGAVQAQLAISQLAQQTMFNMPVIQAGNALEIWKVGN